MKFAQLGAPGAEIPVALHEGRTFDLRALTAQIDAAFLEHSLAECVQQVQSGALPELEGASELRIGAPIARPSAIVCVGMNYVAHAAESGSAPPENIVVFNKLPNTIAGPNDDVTIPKSSEKTDWEVELGIVIGKRASNLTSIDDAAAHIAGYVLANDLSERAWQLEISGGQWGKGKSAPGFSPIGPWFVTSDAIDAQNVRLRSWVNGDPRQDSNTADMIFPVNEIVYELSQYMAFEPGDLILTGTPQGVALSGRFPYLQPGDVVEVEIEGLGRQRQSYVASEAAAS